MHPDFWPGFQIVFRYRPARYEIQVENPACIGHGISHAMVDRTEITQRPLRLRLVDDGAIHELRVRLG